MPYVGNPLANAFSSRVKQDLTGQSGTSFTLTHAVSSANDLSVYINHVRQEPVTAYTVDYNTLTTTGSVAGTDDFYIIYDELGLQSIAHDSAQAMKATSGTFTGAITATGVTSSGGVAGTTGTFSGAVSGTTGTFSGAVSGTTGTFSTGNPQVFLNATSDGGEGSINFKDDQGNVDGKIAYRTDYAGNTDNYMTFNTNGSNERVRIDNIGRVGIGTTSPITQLHVKGNDGIILEDDGTTNLLKIQTGNSGDIFFYTGTTSSSSSKLQLPSAGGLKVRNAAATGPIVDIGTTSTSVADDGVIGGIDFSSGASSTVNARLHARQYGTSENAGYFSNELRAPNGNSLGEVSREYITQNAHGGIYAKRPMPANIFYWREFYKSINVTNGSTGNDFLVLNQNDYYMSFACFVDMWFLDTNYPTAAFCRRYGLTGHTHLGLSSLNSRLTQYLDMGEWNTGSSEISSGSASVWLTKTTSKSAGSNNGHCRIQWNTGSYSQGSMTVRLTGMFLNTRVDAQDITANI